MTSVVTNRPLREAITIESHSASSLVKESSSFPFAPLDLRIQLAQPLIYIRDELHKLPTGQGGEKFSKFEEALPNLFKQSELAFMQGLQEYKLIASQPDFSFEAYFETELQKFEDEFDADPEVRIQQINNAKENVLGLFKTAISLSAEAFEVKSEKESEPSKTTIKFTALAGLRLASADGVEGLMPQVVRIQSDETSDSEKRNLLAGIPRKKPEDPNKKDDKPGVFDGFLSFMENNRGGFTLTTLAIGAALASGTTTAAGLTQWNLLDADGSLGWIKCGIAIGEAVGWNAAQSIMAAFAIGYFQEGSLNAIGNTLRNFRDERFKTVLNLALGISLGILAYRLLSRDIAFTAEALEKFAGNSTKDATLVALLLEVGSQFLIAYSSPVRGVVSLANLQINKLTRKKETANEPIAQVTASDLETDVEKKNLKAQKELLNMYIKSGIFERRSPLGNDDEEAIGLLEGDDLNEIQELVDAAERELDEELLDQLFKQGFLKITSTEFDEIDDASEFLRKQIVKIPRTELFNVSYISRGPALKIAIDHFLVLRADIEEMITALGADETDIIKEVGDWSKTPYENMQRLEIINEYLVLRNEIGDLINELDENEDVELLNKVKGWEILKIASLDELRKFKDLLDTEENTGDEEKE